MRNLIDLININSLRIVNEDLKFSSISDNKIVLDDPENDEVKNLEKSSPEKKEEILTKVEKDMHESTEPKVLTKEEKALVRQLQAKARDHQMWANEAIDQAAEALANGDETTFKEKMEEVETRVRKKGALLREYRDILGTDY